MDVKKKRKLTIKEEVGVISKHGNEIFCILLLPDDVLVFIFQHLDTISIVNCSKVCRRWYHISRDQSLTKTFDLCSRPMLLKQLWKVSHRKLRESTSSIHIKGKLGLSNIMERLSINYLIDLFKRCKRITNLSLECFDLRHISIEIFTLESLESLSLSESMVTMGWFDSLKTRNTLPNLKSLNLNSCSKICNNDLHALAYLKDLETLILCQCYRISARGIPSIVANIKTLKHLEFSGCPAINNVVLYHLSSLHLNHLSLRFCHLITDAGVTGLLRATGNARKTLRYLDLFSCHEITNKTLDIISLNVDVNVFRVLDVGACGKVTIDKVEGFKKDLTECIVKCQVVGELELTSSNENPTHSAL